MEYDLFVHIGLPKCGSTTIQKEVLKGVPGYLGKGNLLYGIDFAKRFQWLALNDAYLSKFPEKANIWKEEVHRMKDLFWPDEQRLIISDENLAKRNATKLLDSYPLGGKIKDKHCSNRSIISFLRTFSEKIWASGTIKILLLLRNQPDWLASLYAQRSKIFFNASQQNFEKEVDRLINENDDYINWSIWCKELYKNFGEENVCVLLMEDMDKEGFWSNIAEFLSIKNINPSDMAINISRSNILKSGDAVWNLPSFGENDGRYLLKNFLRLYWNGGFPESMRNKFIESIGQASQLTNFDSLLKKRFDNERGSQIFMSKSLRERIRTYCFPFNKELSKILGRDVEKEGY